MSEKEETKEQKKDAVYIDCIDKPELKALYKGVKMVMGWGNKEAVEILELGIKALQQTPKYQKRRKLVFGGGL